MGSGALQITISLFAILGAAGLALVCDYLRHRNEELKTAMVAMKSSRIEAPAFTPTPIQHRRKIQHEPEAEPEPSSEPEVKAEAPAAQEPAPLEMHSRRPRRRRPPLATEATHSQPEAEMERSSFIERALSVASGIASREEEAAPKASSEMLPLKSLTPRKTAPKAPKSDIVPILQQMSTDGAMKDWLSRRAAARMAVQKVAAPIVEPIIELPAPQAAAKAEPIAPEPQAPATPAVAAALDHELWAAPQGEPKLVLVARNERAFEPVACPSGLQDSAALARLLSGRQSFTGLVICVGVKDIEERVVNNAVCGLLKEMAHPGDLLFRSSKDEFVLLCPDERGAESRRRLSAISQQLWDYQLRNLSNFAVLFKWGSEEAWHASLSDALEAARQSMRLTARSRGQQTARRQAV
jgi:hypothetical protein